MFGLLLRSILFEIFSFLCIPFFELNKIYESNDILFIYNKIIYL